MRIGKDASLGTLVLVNVYWLPLSLQEAALLAIAIPAALLRIAPADHVAVYSILASLINVINVFLPWPVGALSDRLRGKGTPRQALALLGTVLNVAGLVLAMSARTIATFDGAIILATSGAAISTLLRAFAVRLRCSVRSSGWSSAVSSNHASLFSPVRSSWR